jgi:tetratricopeptide (TPR) repeat protein
MSLIFRRRLMVPRMALGLLATEPVTPARHLLRIAVVLVVAAASVLGYRQISGMDRILFQPSPQGIKALTLYLTARYEDAASAYRAHWGARVLSGRSTGDPGADLILTGDLPGAERLARRDLAHAPNAIEPLLLLAEIALEREAPAEAERLAERVLAVEPENGDAQLMLSLARARQGQAGPAIDTLSRVLRAGQVGERLVTFYQLLATTGVLGARQSADRSPCLLAYYHRYLRIFDRAQARPAARYARAAIAAGDRVADAHVTLGVLAEKAGRLDEAFAEFGAAVEADPRHAEAHRLAAIAYGQRGDLVNEHRMITAALAVSGDVFYADYVFDVLVNKIGDPARAAALLEPLLPRAPRDARLRQRLGHVWVLLGDDTRALGYYHAAMALAPDDVDVQNGLGFALRRLGRYDEAIVALQRTIDLAPGWYAPHSELVNVYHSMHRYPEAIREGEIAQRLGEPNLSVHAMLCNHYHYVVDLERGAACARALLARDPGNVTALFLLYKIGYEASLP